MVLFVCLFVLLNQSSNSEERADGRAFLRKGSKALTGSPIKLCMEEERTGLAEKPGHCASEGTDTRGFQSFSDHRRCAL